MKLKDEEVRQGVRVDGVSICERIQQSQAEWTEKQIKAGTAFVHTEYGLLVKLIRFYKL